MNDDGCCRLFHYPNNLTINSQFSSFSIINATCIIMSFNHNVEEDKKERKLSIPLIVLKTPREIMGNAYTHLSSNDWNGDDP